MERPKTKANKYIKSVSNGAKVSYRIKTMKNKRIRKKKKRTKNTFDILLF